MSEFLKWKPLSSKMSTKPFTKEEEMEMWFFLLRKIRNSYNGKVEKLNKITKYDLWDEFRISYNSNRRPYSYEKRFDCTMAPFLDQTTFDISTKIELYFGLSVCVKKNILEYMQKNGVVKLNEAGCIIKYKEWKDGGLDLGESIVNCNESRLSRQEYVDRDLDDTIDPTIIDSLINKNDADIATAHESPRKKTPEIEKPETSDDRPNAFTANEEMEMWLFLLRKLRNSETPKLKFSSKYDLWNEFKLNTNGHRNPMHYEQRFEFEMIPSLHLTSLMTQYKVELYFGMNIPVDENFLRILKRNADIEVDESCCIKMYKERRAGGLVLGENKSMRAVQKETSHLELDGCSEVVDTESDQPISSLFTIDMNKVPEASSVRKECPKEKAEASNVQVKRKIFTTQEEDDMWKFLLQKVRNPMTGKAEKLQVSSKYELWSEFKTISNGKRHVRDYLIRYERIMSSTLHLAQFATQLKTELYYGLNLPVNVKFLKGLREHAFVELDNQGCIRKYKEKDNRDFVLGISEEVDESNKKKNQVSKKTIGMKQDEKKEKIAGKAVKKEVTDKNNKSNSAQMYDWEPETIRYKISDFEGTSKVFLAAADEEKVEEKKQKQSFKNKKIAKKNVCKKSLIDFDSDSDEETERENDRAQYKGKTGKNPIKSAKSGRKGTINFKDSSEESYDTVSDEYDPTKEQNGSRKRKRSAKDKKTYKRKSWKISMSDMESDYEDVGANPATKANKIRPLRKWEMKKEETGPFIERKQYLKGLRILLSEIDSPEIEKMRQELDKKLNSCEEGGKSVSVDFVRQIIESSIVTTLYCC